MPNMFDYSKIYRELDKLQAKGFSLQKTGDTSKVAGKNFNNEVILTDREISLEMEVRFDNGRQIDYQIDNDLYDLEKYKDVTNELLEDAPIGHSRWLSKVWLHFKETYLVANLDRRT